MKNSLKDFALSYLNETSTVGDMGSIAVDTGLNNVIMDITTRVWDHIVAKDLVGVQPLKTPVGVYFAIKYYSNTTYDGSLATELGHQKVDPNYATSTEELGSNTIANVGTAPNEYPGTGGGLGIGTGQGIREIDFKIEKKIAQVKTKKLKSKISLELLQDVQAMHNLNLRDEILNALAKEIAVEIDTEIIDTIAAKATVYNLDFALVNASGENAGNQADTYAGFVSFLTAATARIGERTMMGAGNFVIASPRISAALEATSMYSASSIDKDKDKVRTNSDFYAGEINNIKLYRNYRWTTDMMIVGYKGDSEMKSGLFYLPYTFLSLNDVYEDSFSENLGAMSRYAISDSPFGPENFYEKIIISNFR